MHKKAYGTICFPVSIVLENAEPPYCQSKKAFQYLLEKDQSVQHALEKKNMQEVQIWN